MPICHWQGSNFRSLLACRLSQGFPSLTILQSEPGSLFGPHSLSVLHSISRIGGRYSKEVSDELPMDSFPGNRNKKNKTNPNINNLMVVQFQKPLADFNALLRASLDAYLSFAGVKFPLSYRIANCSLGLLILAIFWG